MSKYENVLAEAASVIASHGFAETVGTVDYGPGWHAWVTVTPTVLLNIGEGDLAEQIRAESGDTELEVIIRENSQGFVDLIGSWRVTSSAERAWNAIAAEYADEGEDDETQPTTVLGALVTSEILAGLLATPLTSAEQAVSWIWGMHVLGYGAHPDTRGADLIRSTRDTWLFDADQAEQYDARMTEVFGLVADPYAIGLDAIRALDAARVTR